MLVVCLHKILMRNRGSGHIATVDVADPSWTDLSTVACSKGGRKWCVSRSLTPYQSPILYQKGLEAYSCGCMSMEIPKEKRLKLASTCLPLGTPHWPDNNGALLVFSRINGDANRRLVCSVCNTVRVRCVGPMGLSCSWCENHAVAHHQETRKCCCVACPSLVLTETLTLWQERQCFYHSNT